MSFYLIILGWSSDNFRLIDIALAALACGGLVTLPGWSEGTREDGPMDHVKPFPKKLVLTIVCGGMTVSTLFMLISALWQHTAAVSASSVCQYIENGALETSVGTAAASLAWTPFFLQSLTALGVLTMIVSMRLLERLE